MAHVDLKVRLEAASPSIHFSIIPGSLYGLVAIVVAFACSHTGAFHDFLAQVLRLVIWIDSISVFAPGSYARGCSRYVINSNLTKRHGRKRQEAKQTGISSNLCGMRSVLSYPLLSSTVSAADAKPPFAGYSHAIHVTVGLILDIVHCRRRKIRCLVAPDDTEGRCENCIRLRKDCQFFPVDQQPPIEKKSRPSSRLETPSTERSTTTPIASSPSNLVPETTETFYPYPTMAMDTPAQDMSSYNVGMVQTNMSLTPGRQIPLECRTRVN